MTLPRFEERVIRRYEAMFALLCRPAVTACRIAARSLPHEHDVGGLPRHVHGGAWRDADVGGTERGHVVQTVPEVADRVSGRAQGGDRAGLVLRRATGLDPHLPRRQPQLPAHPRRRRRMVAREDPHADPQVGQGP